MLLVMLYIVVNFRVWNCLVVWVLWLLWWYRKVSVVFLGRVFRWVWLLLLKVLNGLLIVVIVCLLVGCVFIMVIVLVCSWLLVLCMFSFCIGLGVLGLLMVRFWFWMLLI